MGNQKQKWTAEEEEALLAGVAKHGAGKWKNILQDPEFSSSLILRSNIDLKDKWRNLSVSSGSALQGSKENSRTPRVKTATAGPVSSTPNSARVALLTRNVSSGTVTDDPSSNALDGKNVSRYNAMILEAISTINDMDGSDIGSIIRFIEERHEVPQSFRKSMSARLRKLASQGKVEKVQNFYKIRKDISFQKPHTPKQKDFRLRLYQNSVARETVEEASITAAYRIAEAENKAFLAAEAVKEAERISKMAEDTDSMYQLVEGIYEQCLRGEILLLMT